MCKYVVNQLEIFVVVYNLLSFKYFDKALPSKEGHHGFHLTFSHTLLLTNSMV